MTLDADVIISGAGPAGSMAAYELAVRGVSVLLLEKSVFPRYKVCGAGLTHKVLEEIPYTLEPVIETRICSVSFSKGLKEPFLRTSSEPLMYCTMRDTLDGYMADRAADTGVKVIFGERVTAVTQMTGHAEVQTKSRVYRSRVVIGADGAAGTVARTAGLKLDMESGMAWEAEIFADPALVKGVSGTVCLDWGTLPGGYAWMFPKGDHLSAGVGGPAGMAKHMIPYFQGFLRTILHPGIKLPHPGPNGPHPGIKVPHPGPLLEGEGDFLPYSYVVNSLRSWPIPVRREKGPFHNGSILVAGDAAGLTDALTGEGIYYAVRSGKLAAEACSGYLAGKHATLSRYSEAVNSELMPELLEAVRIRDVFNAVPLKIHRLVRDNDRVWRAFGKILRGERHYADVRRGFGKLKFLWGTATFLAGIAYKWKELRHRNDRVNG
jgi:geranylgeranyl reductase family protein